MVTRSQAADQYLHYLDSKDHHLFLAFQESGTPAAITQFYKQLAHDLKTG